MKIISVNVNGVRSASSKGLLAWLQRQKADVVCMQEIKAQEADMPEPIRNPAKLSAHFNPAAKRGYSGVGIYCRQAPDRVITGIGSKEFDPEGRYLQVDFGNLSIVSVYVPSGSSSEERQQAKFRFLDEFLPVLRRLRASGRELVLCGDWNIAHQEIDLKNWRSNQKNSGFLPAERAWLTRVFDDLGWVDVFRRIDQRAEQYTWWSNRGESWAKNVGWRLDYQIATPGVAATAHKVAIYKTSRFSDHAPLTIDYEWKI